MSTFEQFGEKNTPHVSNGKLLPFPVLFIYSVYLFIYSSFFFLYIYIYCCFFVIWQEAETSCSNSQMDESISSRKVNAD